MIIGFLTTLVEIIFAIGITLLIFLAVSIVFAVPLLIVAAVTHLLIWFINGMFGYNLADKFWYIFVGIAFILPMVKSMIRMK